MANHTNNLATPTPKRRCTAHKKGKDGKQGERCKAWALKGQKVCRVHGGKAPQNLAAGERRVDCPWGRASAQSASGRTNQAQIAGV